MRKRTSETDANYWTEVAGAWQEAHPQTLWRRHADAVNVALYRRWLPRVGGMFLLKTDLFDEAVGEGLYRVLASRVRTVVGMDISVLTAQVALERYPSLCGTAGDARCLPFADATFDVIASNSTLDHFGSRDEIVTSIQELRRVLRPRGELVLTLDNLSNPVVALRQVLPFRFLNRLGLVPYYVGSTYGPGQLHRVLERVGFEVVQIGSLLHCPRVAGVVLARLANTYTKPATQQRILRILTMCERLSKLPTRYWTGYFVAVKAIRSE